jgi:hypothetical protein
MMHTIKQITQPQPCHEPWGNMSPVANGRFCSSCNKAVVDFTAMTNQQIIDHLSAAPGNLCGRISALQFNEVNHQLAEQLPVKAGLWKRMLLTVTMLASLSYVKGQTAAPTVKTEQTPASVVTGEVVAVNTPVKLITLTGTVKDSEGRPLEQATVKAGNQSTLTNASGVFRLKIPEGTKTFQVLYVGAETQIIKINKQSGKPYKIKLQSSAIYLGGLATIKRPGRLMHLYNRYITMPLKALIG